MFFSKSVCLAAAAFLTYANALDETAYPFQAPTDTDVRSPCPALNSLANHGLLPRDGKNIDLATLEIGMFLGFSLAKEATDFVGSTALSTSTTGNASTFNLNDVAQHDPQALEHDGSMTRNDSFFGDNLSFNDQAWARTLANWGDNETISFAVAAAERTARFQYGAATNPEFNSTFANTPSLIEYSLFLSGLGDVTDGNANITFAKYMLENERLPIELGWQPSATNITIASVLTMVSQITALL